MFESQTHSLASLTFLVQLTGLLLIICYRLRGPRSRFNQIGLLFGILLIAASSIGCLMADCSTGLVQGVVIVVVAVCTTMEFGGSSRPASF